MRIGIIGAGNMGATLAFRLTRLGHQVTIANSRGPQTLADVAARTGATPIPITQVSSKADVVIVAIPEKSVPALAAGLLNALPDDAVVVDTGNYVPQLRDGHIDAIDAGPLAESWRQQPGTTVYTADLPLDAARLALADATPEQTASWRRRDPREVG